MPSSGPVSAFAARKARQQQAQNGTPPKIEQAVNQGSEPPSKRPRRSTEAEESHEPNGTETRTSRTRSSKKHDEPMATETVKGQEKTSTRSAKSVFMQRALDPQKETGEGDELEEEEGENAEMSEDEVASVIGDADGYESPADTPVELQNFPVSKARINKSNIVYADNSTLCVRIREKTVRVDLQVETVILTCSRT